MEMTNGASEALQELNLEMNNNERRIVMPFREFLVFAQENPRIVFRSIFQSFALMVESLVGPGHDEYPGDPESINFVKYDTSKLFTEGLDHPFFADRLFANRFIKRVEKFRRGSQQNKIYIFIGPPGCGKTTFLNNILKKFEEYTNTKEGVIFETVWRINENLSQEINKNRIRTEKIKEPAPNEQVEIPCPSHDHPIVIIPKNYRAAFLDKLFKNDKIKHDIATEKEYEWIFEDEPCTVCRSLFWALFDRLGSVDRILDMIYARAYKFDRRIGEGISVFNPGDPEEKRISLTDKQLQERINKIFGSSNTVRYIFSRYARTNNGIYVLMDIKNHNKERLFALHNIISEGVHRVENIEEGVKSLFIAVMNPEDQTQDATNNESFADRIEYVGIPYVMEVPVEIEIYRKIFGTNIETNFLPRVLDNFARIIISTRLSLESKAIKAWLKNPEKYKKFCDEQGLLLKMSIYTGIIPAWLSEEDRRNFTSYNRRNIINEGNSEGKIGITGRDSIKIFSEFFSQYGTKGRLITMADLCYFFRKKIDKTYQDQIPDKFIESILRLYNYTVLQEVKESLYCYNQDRVSRDIQNYLFAINFEQGTTVKCSFTGEELEITEHFLRSIENFLLDSDANEKQRMSFREETQKEYASQTLTKEIRIENIPIISTTLYQKLLTIYTWSLKEMVLEPFLANENFRNAIKAYGTEEYKIYDKKIKEDVAFLIRNLIDKFGYNEQSAKEVCIYVIDHKLAKNFKNS